MKITGKNSTNCSFRFRISADISEALSEPCQVFREVAIGGVL